MFARMKTTWGAALLIMSGACSEHGQSPGGMLPTDSDPTVALCSSGPSAVVTGSAGTFDRVYAGAVSLAGPVAGPGFAGPPMQIQVVFSNLASLDPETLGCCMADLSCCAVDTLVALTDPVASGSEIGSHGVTFRKTGNSDVSVPGTLAITTFVDPFASRPGKIVGTIHAAAGGQTVDGDFGNEFCPALLTVTL
ncbi:MAG: hypothetical protein H6Q90_2812 [Deltaproteobacteria bacterium]|nr:hypothetical protein [Deltaproteobacteria bacterium]